MSWLPGSTRSSALPELLIRNFNYERWKDEKDRNILSEILICADTQTLSVAGPTGTQLTSNDNLFKT